MRLIYYKVRLKIGREKTSMRKKSLDVEEYISLRKEILQWQARRFFLITTTATLVTGILGFGIGNIEKMWFMISSSLLLFLACTTSLSWYAGKGNAKIGAYIAVFFEEIGGGKRGWFGLGEQTSQI